MIDYHKKKFINHKKYPFIFGVFVTGTLIEFITYKIQPGYSTGLGWATIVIILILY